MTWSMAAGTWSAPMAELTAQAAVFAPYAHGDLRPLLDVTETAPWPGPSSMAGRGAGDRRARRASAPVRSDARPRSTP